MRSTPVFRRAAWGATAALAASLAGCGLMRGVANAPVDAFHSMFGGKDAPANLAGLQLGLQSFADEYMRENASALDEYARRAGTEDARSQVLHWKVRLGSSALGIVSESNPVANLVDLMVLATLTRMIFESYEAKVAEKSAFQIVLVASRNVEEEAWKLGQHVIDEPTRKELREILDKWRTANPVEYDTFLTRPREITKIIIETAKASKRGGDSTNVLGMIGLDPLAGLDPAVREVTQSRLLAERALYTAQRMPILLQWQVELVMDEFLRRQEVVAVNADMGRIGRAAESIGETAASLPARIAAEREALVKALEEQEGRLGELSEKIRPTLDAGEKMSTSLRATIVAFDALLVRLGVGVPKTDAEKPASASSHPFDIREFTRAAEQLAVTAKELDAVVNDTSRALDLPAIEKRIDDAKSVLDRAFLLGAGIVVFTFACALTYRRLRR